MNLHLLFIHCLHIAYLIIIEETFEKKIVKTFETFEKKIVNGKTIRYKLKFIDSFRFM